MFLRPSRMLLSTRAWTAALLVDCRIWVAAEIRAFSRSILRKTSAMAWSVSAMATEDGGEEMDGIEKVPAGRSHCVEVRCHGLSRASDGLSEWRKSCPNVLAQATDNEAKGGMRGKMS